MIIPRDIRKLTGYKLDNEQLHWLGDAKAMREALLHHIASATKRIYLVCLYLEDDEAGREIFDALIAAKKRNPNLDIKLLVDFHRAQRGLIGHAEALGNKSMYQQKIKEAQVDIQIVGIPVKRKEVLGVLHLKGFVFDDTVLYSGASINNVYLNVNDRYRLDRYYKIDQPELADAFTQLIDNVMISDLSIQSLLNPEKAAKKPLNQFIKRFKKLLQNSQYEEGSVTEGARITPLVGFGKSKNLLNKATVSIIKAAKSHIFICTPYFNPPMSIVRALSKQLKNGVVVDIVVGDKTANDFFIPEGEPFNLIGAVPYLYEQSLRKFLRRYQWAVDKNLLRVHLWKHDNNSYHLKGISVDDELHLITGSNLNPRAWALDIENGLVLQDPNQQWRAKFSEEQQSFLAHCHQIERYEELQLTSDYRPEAQKILKRIHRIRGEVLLKRIL